MEDSSDSSAPYHKWLDIPPEFCPPNHYVLLGVEDFSEDTSAIDAAAKSRTAYLHQIAAGPDRKIVQSLLGEVAVARRTLLNDVAKSEYDHWLSTPEEDPTDANAETFDVVSDTKERQERSSKSRKRRTVAQGDASSKPITRRRRTSTWDSYKYHLLSASVLACAVGVFAFVNRDGGRQASAVPETQSSPPPERQKFSRPLANKSTASPTRPTAPPLPNPANASKRSSSGLSGPGGLDMAEFMKAGSAEDRSSGFASFNSNQPSIPAPTKATKIKLTAQWRKGLKRLDVFNNDFDKHFPNALGKGTLFGVQNGEFVLKRADSNEHSQNLTLASKRLAMGEAIAIDTSLQKGEGQDRSIGVFVGDQQLSLHPTKTGVSIRTKMVSANDKPKSVGFMRLPKSPKPITILLARDGQDATTLRWVVQTGKSAMAGRLNASLMTDPSPFGITIVTPTSSVNSKLTISDFRLGKLASSPPWPK